MSPIERERAKRRRNYYAAKIERAADLMASVPDVSRGDARLMAEVLLASRRGKRIPPEVALKAEEVLQTLARS